MVLVFVTLVLAGCQGPDSGEPGPPVWSFSPPPQGVYETRVAVRASAGPGHKVYLSISGDPTKVGTRQKGPVWLGGSTSWSLNWSTPVGLGWDTVRSTTYRLDPARPQAAAGADHSLVIDDTVLWSWGNNHNGQLGLGNKTSVVYPDKATVDLEVVLAVWAQGDNTLLLDDTSTLWVCGSGPWLFDQTEVSIALPRRVPLPEGTRVKTAAINDFGAVWAVDKDGQLWVWGANGFGALGVDSAEVTTPVVALQGVSLVAAGPYHTVVLKSDRSLWVAGTQTADQARLGTGTSADASSWVRIGGTQTWSGYSLEASWEHAGLLTEDGELWMWGSNSFGQIPGVEGALDVPTLVAKSVAAFAVASRSTLVLPESGVLQAFGEVYGTPPPLSVSDGVRSLQLGGFHGLALTADFHSGTDPWKAVEFWGDQF